MEKVINRERLLYYCVLRSFFAPRLLNLRTMMNVLRKNNSTIAILMSVN